jgi:hypothetical protein
MDDDMPLQVSNQCDFSTSWTSAYIADLSACIAELDEYHESPFTGICCF